mmetsp:Transcript_14620/g.24897  ORF Transcript_14620/g.24897 Transcript_14620/m.24897 type:complete len:131 (-) Transcript_14620:41-433(-)
MTKGAKREYTARKASETGNIFKQCARSLGKGRSHWEKECRVRLPHCLVPCLTCICVTIKVVILQLIEPLIVPIACVAACISCLARVVHSPHGEDLVYSCLECCEITDDGIGLYWEVDWWRKHEKGEILQV